MDREKMEQGIGRSRKEERERLTDVLANRLSGSELSSLLLDVYRAKLAEETPAGLLRQYRDNRFVKPAVVDALALKQLELDVLHAARRHGFEPVQLSPVAPLGSCSVVATADQHKIVSAVRGTEVVADATNLLALHASEGLRSGELDNRSGRLRFAATHRHVRAQQFPKQPGMFSHFHIGCLVSSGIDQGSYSFEIPAFWEHVEVYRDLFRTLYQADIEVILNPRGGYKDAAGLVQRVLQAGIDRSIPVQATVNPAHSDNAYYLGFQFTIKTTIRGKVHFIGDGGFVDWTQQLLGNRKERFLISAIGLDRLLLDERTRI